MRDMRLKHLPINSNLLFYFVNHRTKCGLEIKLTIRCACGVVHAGSMGASGVCSATEPVVLIHFHVAPAAHAALKVTFFWIRALRVQQQHIIESHVSLVWGTRLHSFNHYLECKAWGDTRQWLHSLFLLLHLFWVYFYFSRDLHLCVCFFFNILLLSEESPEGRCEYWPYIFIWNEWCLSDSPCIADLEAEV